MRGLASFILANGLALGAMAQVRITEAMINPPARLMRGASLSSFRVAVPTSPCRATG